MSRKEDIFLNAWKVKDPSGYAEYKAIKAELLVDLENMDAQLEDLLAHIDADDNIHSPKKKELLRIETDFKKQLNAERKANIEKRISTIAEAVISERDFRYGAGEAFSSGLIGDTKYLLKYYLGTIDKLHDTLSMFYFGEKP